VSVLTPGGARGNLRELITWEAGQFLRHFRRNPVSAFLGAMIESQRHQIFMLR
jgi:hypothetical protein